jgi:hypothetical protein
MTKKQRQRYNRRYYKKNRIRMIREERQRRQQKSLSRINNGERLRKLYNTEKKNKHGHSVCEHNIEIYRCVPCGGGGMCEHKVRRYSCRFCSPLGWAKRVLRDLENNANQQGYAAPKTTPQEILDLRNKAKICALCEALLGNEKPVLHHNHTTGTVIGFSHNRCNSIEGFFENMQPVARKTLVRKLGRL